MAHVDTRLEVLPLEESWSCHSCGICCKARTVFLDDDDLRRLEQQGWQKRPEFQQTPVVKRVGWSRRPVLNQRPDGSCVFLEANGLCQIHRELGEEAKPWACRAFPFEFIPFEHSLMLTLRRNCPSAAADKGRSLAKQLEEARPFVPLAFPRGTTVAPPAVVHRGKRHWPASTAVQQTLVELMLDTQRPLVRRLAQALQFIELVAKLPEARGAAPDLDKRLGILRDAAEDGLREVFRDRPPASRAGQILFRQAAGEYTRFHPNVADRPGIRERLRLLAAGWRIARGQGALPNIHPSFPTATFSDLERPLGILPPEILAPITSYFEAAVGAMRYCGSAHFGWSIVDGFRALGLAYAIGLWTLRWRCGAKGPTASDAVDVVRVLDRSHDYPLFGGFRHRRRLALLAQRGDLVRLAAWYAR